MAPVPTVVVARAIAELEGYPIESTRLVKLTCLAHAYHLAATDEPLIDELVEAWPLGPNLACLSAYLKSEYGLYVDEPLPQRLSYYEGGPAQPEKTRWLLTSAERRTVEAVVDAYDGWSTNRICESLKANGSPWAIVRNRPGFVPRNAPIPNELLRMHYVPLVKRPDAPPPNLFIETKVIEFQPRL